ncbi:MAG: glycosyltransferase family 4 protein [Thermomicrobiales bacterium]|nr:glycosyltransferase family 4 protein [Thermomicrobiales bacterium]
MRVLVVSHLYPNDWWPILGSFVADHVAALRQAGVDVTVVNPMPWVPPLAKRLSGRYRFITDHLGHPREFEGVRVLPARYAAAPRSRLFWLGGPTLAASLFRRAEQRHSRDTYDLVHAHVILPDGYAAAKWGQRRSIPVICTAHGNDVNIDPHFNRLTRMQTRWTIRSVDAMIAVSSALSERMCQLATPKQVKIIPNGVNLDVFTPIDRNHARRQLGLPEEIPIILFVGSLLPVKGVQHLIGAFHRVRERVPDAMLVLVGEGSLRSELEATAERLGVDQAVRFAGRQARELIPTWMAAADLLTLPSENEGMPLVVLEAMASGLPVVASDVGGIGEAMGFPRPGILTPPGDEAILASAIVELLLDPVLRRRMGMHGRNRSRSLTWSANAESTVQLYRDVLNRSGQLPLQRQTTVRGT